MQNAERKCRGFVALLLVGLLFLFAACNGSRELYDLGIVLGIGLDRSAEEGAVDMTLQLASGLQGEPGGGMGGLQSGEAFINYTLPGDVSLSHFRQFKLRMQKEVYLAHNELFVIGEPLARAGIGPYIDFFLRDPELRVSTNILVAKGSAAELLAAEAMLSEYPTLSLSQREDSYPLSGATSRCSLFDFVSAMASECRCATVPMAELQAGADGEPISVFNGLAIFRGDTMIGTLTQEEVSGLLFLTDAVRNGALRFSVDGSVVEVELQRSKTKLCYTVQEDGTADILVTIRSGGRIVSRAGGAAERNSIIRAGETRMQEEMLMTLRRAQELHADIFGFGDAIAKCEPDWWEVHGGNWEANLPRLRFAFDIVLEPGEL
ncbi:MAG: Ger(x)C family spore germination protein [Clostridiales bacterium]|nr:Ger(x)C family spore germination protein [Clostridiales bacterium]